MIIMIVKPASTIAYRKIRHYDIMRLTGGVMKPIRLRRGFTILAIVITIAIVGILSVVAMSIFYDTQDSAVESTEPTFEQPTVIIQRATSSRWTPVMAAALFL